MKEITAFLNENKFGSLATCRGSSPDVRPLELLCSDDGKILFYLSDSSDAYREICKNSNICYCATDKDYNYIKVSATAKISDNVKDKQNVLTNSSFADKVYQNDSQHMKVFELTEGTCILHRYMDDDVIKSSF